MAIVVNRSISGANPQLNVTHPVGTIYQTENITFNPNTAWGGTWVEDTSYQLVAYAHTSGATGVTIDVGKNISSVSRTATGNYTVTFTHQMADANYIVHVNSESSGSRGYELAGVFEMSKASFKMDFADFDGSARDQEHMYFTVWGRLETPEIKVWKRTA